MGSRLHSAADSARSKSDHEQSRHAQLDADCPWVIRARTVAACNGSVLIEGESGTGKSVLAASLHSWSGRTGRLVRRGCGEFHEASLEAILFGYRRGAFTGAHADQIGLLADADSGTLVLDDIDYLPLQCQSRLLRFLDDGVFCRLGDAAVECHSDARVVATTNKSLARLCDSGRFLPDLMYRLRRWRISVPPIRERSHDIPGLVDQFLDEMYERQPSPAIERKLLAPCVVELLRKMPWPGNLRELRESVENIVVFAKSDDAVVSLTAAVDALFCGEADASCHPPGADSDAGLRQLLDLTNGNISLVSRISGRSRTTIYERLRAMGLR